MPREPEKGKLVAVGIDGRRGIADASLMLHRTLGNSGFEVSIIGFGAWGVGGQWGPVERDAAIDAVRAALDAGVNFFDTADAYGDPPGLSEELIGEALRPVRDRVFMASKVGNFARRAGHPLSYTSPLHVELCCDASLHRLKTDRIDLYQCHIGDLKEPGVFLEAFETLRRKGKIRAFGVSTNRLEVVRAFHRDGKLSAVQLDYSLLNRSAERELLPWCLQNKVGTIIRGPLAMGVLAGKFTRETRFDDSVRAGWNEGAAREKFLRRLETVEKLRFLQTPEQTLAQAALRFVISHEAVTTAIPGAKSRAQALSNAAAGSAMLSPDLLARAREVTAGMS